jgi:hypothetical protein
MRSQRLFDQRQQVRVVGASCQPQHSIDGDQRIGQAALLDDLEDSGVRLFGCRIPKINVLHADLRPVPQLQMPSCDKCGLRRRPFWPSAAGLAGLRLLIPKDGDHNRQSRFHASPSSLVYFHCHR